MSKNLKTPKRGMKPKRKSADAATKYKYPNMTFRPTPQEEMGLRLLKKQTNKPMGFFISQGIRIVLQRNNIKFPPIDLKRDE